MSLEAHPNLHAVGLQIDVLESILKRVRGDGEKINQAALVTSINTKILEFVIDIEEIVDDLAKIVVASR